MLDGPLMGLTAKQRAVLDLVIQHKTSKEISRMLGISPHTVDQRIMLARAKLNVATRGEVAQAYRLLLAEQGKSTAPAIYQQTVYGSSDIAAPVQTDQHSWQEDAVTAPAGLSREQTGRDQTGREQTGSVGTLPRHNARLFSDGSAQGYYHVLPEAFDGRIGTLLRLGAIATITVFLTLVILGGLAIYAQLSHMLDS
jgi:DNA-binding CsgD family transcriptional regulator